MRNWKVSLRCLTVLICTTSTHTQQKALLTVMLFSIFKWITDPYTILKTCALLGAERGVQADTNKLPAPFKSRSLVCRCSFTNHLLINIFFREFSSEPQEPTLLPCELKYNLVTLALPAWRKQTSCWGRVHSNIRTLPSWAPVRSETQKEKQKINEKSTEFQYFPFYQWISKWQKPLTMLWVTSKTLTVLMDWVGGHSLNIM